PIWHSFHVEIHKGVGVWHGGLLCHENCFFSDGQCLERVMMLSCRVYSFFLFSPGAKGVRILSNCENPFAILRGDFGLSHAPEQAEIVLLHGLGTASAAEFADLAVIV